MKLLFAEDMETLTMVLEAKSQYEGHEAIFVSCLSEMKLALKIDPDIKVIISDLMMPDTDVPELLSFLASTKLPVIILSNWPERFPEIKKVYPQFILQTKNETALKTVFKTIRKYDISA